MYSNFSQILLLYKTWGVLKQIWLYEFYRGILLICQNTTMQVNRAWIKRYRVLCSKPYNTLRSFHNFPAGSRQATRGARICETILLLSHLPGAYELTNDEKDHWCMNPLWPSGTIWYHRIWSVSFKVMVKCPMAPSHYMNWCSFVINDTHCIHMGGGGGGTVSRKC